MNIDNERELQDITNYVADIRNNHTFIPTDMTDYQTTSTNFNKPKIAYLIIDTNFILSHLTIIEDLEKLLHEKYMGLYHIVIPKQVIHELDGLKESSKSFNGESRHSISRLARVAIDWCYTHFHESVPTVSGQRIHERIDKDAIKDNAILDCCLYFQNVENGGNNLVVLMSDDKNLCNKALVNNVLTISYRAGMTAELIAVNVVGELGNDQQFDQQYQQQQYQQQQYQQQQYPQHEGVGSMMEYDDEIIIEDAQQPQQTQQIQEPTKQDNSMFAVANEIYTQVTTLVLEAIHYAVTSIYEEDLYMIDYNESKMNDLNDAARCIKRLGFSTFADFFDRRSHFNPMKILEDRYAFDKYVRVAMTVPDLRDFVTFWSDFLDGIYKNRKSTQKDALNQIEKSWNARIKQIE